MLLDWDKRLLCKTLSASQDDSLDPESAGDICCLRFSDNRLKYSLSVSLDVPSVFFAADPEEPQQAMPMLEITFRCEQITIRPSAYDALRGNAVCFHERRDCDRSLRLTLEPAADGNWYIWSSGSDAGTAGQET